MQPSLLDLAPRFDGATFDPVMDQARLTSQLARVLAVVADGRWRTLGEIAVRAHAPESSVSARLRDLRKEKFGSYVVARRHRGDAGRGLYEYRLVKG